MAPDASLCAQALGKAFVKQFIILVAISEALLAVLTFLEGQHLFVPPLIRHFLSSLMFSLTNYVRELWLAALY